MKNWNWKQWIAFGVTIAVIIAGMVLHFKQPEVSFAFAEMTTAGGFILGAISGYLYKKNK